MLHDKSFSRRAIGGLCPALAAFMARCAARSGTVAAIIVSIDGAEEKTTSKCASLGKLMRH
jgi:hypothetical protein